VLEANLIVSELVQRMPSYEKVIKDDPASIDVNFLNS
jgi:hypothetical protein